MQNDPVAAALSAVGIPVDFRTFPAGTDTAEQAAAAVGCDLAAIVKSLVFMAGNELVLALVSGADRLDEAKLAAELDPEMLSVRKATAREVEEHTGFKIGTVPPLGHRTPMRVYLDRELMVNRVVWAASGVRHRVFSVSPVMLVAAAGATIADIRVQA